VLAPATVSDARWMLPAALEEQDPVFLFEHAALYGVEGEVDEAAGPADLDRALVLREGGDATAVTWGGSVWKTLAAAELLAQERIEVEVIDLRTLRPLDVETVLGSLAKTHRCVLVDESWRTCGLAAEVSAQIMERGFDLLDWPVQRVASAEVPAPYAKHMEDASLPQPDAIAGALKATLA
jgi:pyruvate/2-oxoglutarate/acetoin dehydrogenase E1 component